MSTWVFISCDECCTATSKTVRGGGTQINQLREQMRRLGWSERPSTKGAKDRCPGCMELRKETAILRAQDRRRKT